MTEFHSISPYELSENPFTLLEKKWALLTAGTPDSNQTCNTMTISWGGMGILWNNPVATVYVRPQRHTYEFMERNPNFSLNFIKEELRSALNLCGKKSGRDIDKAKETGLTPFALEHGTTGFEQARLIIECKKLYFQDLNPLQFLDSELNRYYQEGDYHRMYVGEILSIKESSGK